MFYVLGLKGLKFERFCVPRFAFFDLGSVFERFYKQLTPTGYYQYEPDIDQDISESTNDKDVLPVLECDLHDFYCGFHFK